MNIIKKTIALSDGRTIEIETGKLAKQADGSAVVKMGGTMLLATVTAATEVKEGTDFLPLQVDYREKYYAAGRFPGGFLKRESRPDDYEILISRLVDRPIRPLWPDDFHLEVFVNVMLISAEKDIQLAANAAQAEELGGSAFTPMVDMWKQGDSAEEYSKVFLVRYGIYPDDGYESSEPMTDPAQVTATTKRGNVLRFEWN